MAQQNARLHTDIDGRLTSSEYDGTKWFIFVKTEDGDNEALGSTADGATDQTVIGLLKALNNKMPALQSGALKAVLTGAIPTGTNKIGSVDIANNPGVTVLGLPALPAGSNKIGIVDIGTIPAVDIKTLPAIQIAAGQEIGTIKNAINRVNRFNNNTPLAAAAAFESASLDGLTYKKITGRAFADQAGTLEIQQSDDETTWDTSKTLEITAGTAVFYDEPIYCRYIKVKYTNGATAQTAFRISGYLSAE